MRHASIQLSAPAVTLAALLVVDSHPRQAAVLCLRRAGSRPSAPAVALGGVVVGHAHPTGGVTESQLVAVLQRVLGPGAADDPAPLAVSEVGSIFCLELRNSERSRWGAPRAVTRRP